jgi:trk system potassium uptake protein TrkA
MACFSPLATVPSAAHARLRQRHADVDIADLLRPEYPWGGACCHLHRRPTFLSGRDVQARVGVAAPPACSRVSPSTGNGTMSRQQFVIIGLGLFGETIARELTRLGHEVIGVDTNERLVDRLADTITHAVVADGADEKVIEELNPSQFDAAIVAIGEHSMEANLLATLHLKENGVEKIWVKALTADHHKILTKVGATRIIHPEYEIGMQVAQALNYPMVNHYIALDGDEYIVEITASEKLSGVVLAELLEQNELEVSLLLARRGGRNFPNPTDLIIEPGDTLVLVGKLEQLKKTVKFL